MAAGARVVLMQGMKLVKEQQATKVSKLWVEGSAEARLQGRFDASSEPNLLQYCGELVVQRTIAGPSSTGGRHCNCDGEGCGKQAEERSFHVALLSNVRFAVVHASLVGTAKIGADALQRLYQPGVVRPASACGGAGSQRRKQIFAGDQIQYRTHQVNLIHFDLTYINLDSKSRIGDETRIA